MTDLVIRRLLVDMEAPIPRHWCGGDAFRTALFNALSMSFPFGEQFFIDSVRKGFEVLPPTLQEKYRADMQGFVGQEATHRRLHALFNEHLERQGLRNTWAPRAQGRLKRLEGVEPRHWLAITAANEHFTAVLAEFVLQHPEWMSGDDPRLRTLWMWHAAEESEHRCVAFDLYQALDGDYRWRMKWMRRATLFFVVDTMRQTVNNLHRDGTLWKWSTWTGAARYLLGKHGLVRMTYRPWREYFRRDFHPSQLGTSAAIDWLAAHREQYVPVRG
jgi:predicted metal-dependent hydrolase